ncbi:unnamed protein product [Leptidea sinapis]|uniref:Cns1/TTC4 wheel domain-containing protein n=1 Tax=Leptidea sinapis TaxID=189913 RepID=A0A5E4QKV9_9NEOP|nr:unnamed protein product [Leptidea sinapis]
MTEEINSKSMTDAERLALCQKLDKELDDFIDGLEKKRYTEGWPEDRWEEEMDKHPFFMKSAPKGDEMSPLAEGLARLKYDPEENTPLELANNYKEDGNFNFKHKNYRLAILGLYNNRAAAHWHLKNFRSSLLDCEKALKYNPNHDKARLRAAKSAFEAAMYDKCIEHCEKILEKLQSEDVVELLNMAKKKKLCKERDERKRNLLEAKKKEHKDLLIEAVVKRGIKIANCKCKDDIDISKLEPDIPGAQESMVHIEEGILKWPILLYYPEFKMTDFIKACPENVPLLNQLEQVFPLAWDEENKYSTANVNVFYEGSDRMPHLINPKKNLGDLIVSKYFEVKAGTPAFFVLPSQSLAEREFLESFI